MKLSSSDLARLESVRGAAEDEGILSVYLRIDPAVALHHGHVARLMDVLRSLRESAPEAQQERIREESDRVLAYVREEYTPHGTALIVFSSTPAGLWEGFSFQLPVPCIARFGNRPFLIPLAAVVEDMAPAAVVLADHQEARLYSLRLGELAAQRRIHSAVPGLQRQGGWSAFKYERDRQHHISEHLGRVVAELVELDREQPFECLILAGTDETTHALSSLLPEAMRERLAGSFRSEMFASDAEVADKARAVQEAAERDNEISLAQGLVDTALAGGKAALGKDETMQMLQEGRVHKLVVSEKSYYAPEGEMAASLAIDGDALLEVVHGAAEDILAPYNGLAAMLRY